MSQETQNTPPRAPAGDRTYISAHPERGRSDERYAADNERDYERSRSPWREGRGRYTDRDREDYKSPSRDKSRSRSPYFGAPPNRNVILEGLPLEMTQEDVGRPIPTPLRPFTHHSRYNSILSVHQQVFGTLAKNRDWPHWPLIRCTDIK
jgi:RNA-binding protein 5/10